MMKKAGFLFIAVLTPLWSVQAFAGESTPFSDSFSFSAHFIDFLETNPKSGLTKNSWGNTAQLQLGADVDLERLLDWSGATLHVRESLFGLRRNGVFNSVTGGHFWAQDVGSTLGGAPFPNFIPDAYLSDLSLEQKLGQVTLQGGRMNPVNYFDTPTNCEAALSCQNPITLYDNKTLPPAFATWGGRVGYDIDSSNSVQAGLFEDNFDSNLTNGFDWSTRNASGVFYVGEYSHHESFAESSHPFSYMFGMFHDTTTFSDPNTGEPENGSNGAYWRLKKTLWRGEAAGSGEAPSRYITAFVTGGYSPDDAQPYRFYSEAGVNFHGFLNMRPEDFLGVKFAYLRVNDNEIQAERKQRIAAGGADVASDNDQFRVELNAHFELSSQVSLEPSIQYVWNPNAQFASGSSTAETPKDGFVLGLVLQAQLSSP